MSRRSYVLSLPYLPPPIAQIILCDEVLEAKMRVRTF